MGHFEAVRIFCKQRGNNERQIDFSVSKFFQDLLSWPQEDQRNNPTEEQYMVRLNYRKRIVVHVRRRKSGGFPASIKGAAENFA